MNFESIILKVIQCGPAKVFHISNYSEHKILPHEKDRLCIFKNRLMYSVQMICAHVYKLTASILVNDGARLGCRYDSSSWSDSSSDSISEKER